MNQIHLLISIALSGILFLLISGCNLSQQKSEPESFLSSNKETALIQGSSPNFLVLSDIHLNVHAQNVKYGEDTGMTLWLKTKEKLTEVITGFNPPDFILYLGDLPAHRNWSHPAPKGTHETNLDSVLTGLRELVEKTPDIPLLYLPGNNDAIWGDYCQFSDLPHEKPPYALDSGNAQKWPVLNDHINGSKISPPYVINDKYRMKGFYSAYPLGNRELRVISMNTVIFSTSDCGNPAYPWSDRRNDADTLLTFLDDELRDARKNSEKVIVAMHIPPGLDSYCQINDNSCTPKSPSPMWDNTISYDGVSILDRFLASISTYQDEIVGVFTSHTHMDEIRVLTYQKDTVALAISAPGISPNHSQNPGFKTVTYDRGNTYKLTDFTTMYTTLAEVQNGGSWGSDQYTFRDAYKCQHCPGVKSMLDCIMCKSPEQAYSGMSTTYMVKKDTLCCDLSAIMLVREGQ